MDSQDILDFWEEFSNMTYIYLERGYMCPTDLEICWIGTLNVNPRSKQRNGKPIIKCKCGSYTNAIKMPTKKGILSGFKCPTCGFSSSFKLDGWTQMVYPSEFKKKKKKEKQAFKAVNSSKNPRHLDNEDY